VALAAAQVQRGENCALAFSKNLITIGLIAELSAATASAFAGAIGNPVHKISVTREDVLAALEGADN